MPQQRKDLPPNESLGPPRTLMVDNQEDPLVVVHLLTFDADGSVPDRHTEHDMVNADGGNLLLDALLYFRS